MRHQKNNTPQSLYVDLALSHAFDSIKVLIENTTIQPAPDINFKLITTLNNAYSGHTNLPCLLAPNATEGSTCEHLLLTLCSQGLLLDTTANTNQDPTYITKTTDTNLNEIVRPVAHFLEFLTLSRNEKLFIRLLDFFPSERLDQICKNTQLVNLCVAHNYLEVLDSLHRKNPIDINHIPAPRVPFSSHLDASIFHKNTFPCANAKSIPMLEKLISMGAKLTIQDVYGKTVVQYMMQNDGLDQAMLSFITQKALEQTIQSDTTVRGKKQKISSVTQIDPALVKTLFEAISTNKKNNTKTLINSIGIEHAIHLKGPKGESLLTPALQAQNYPLIKRIINSGFDIHTFDDQGSNFLFRFLTFKYDSYSTKQDRSGTQRDALRQTILKKANFNLTNPQGRSLFWQLWGKRLDDHGHSSIGGPDYITQRMLVDKIIHSHPHYQQSIDPLVSDSTGVTMIEDFTSLITSTSSSPISVISDDPRGQYSHLLQIALSHPNGKPETFKNILHSLLESNRASFWQYAAHYNLITKQIQYQNSTSNSLPAREEYLIRLFDQLFEKSQFNLNNPQDRLTLNALDFTVVLNPRAGAYQKLYHHLEHIKLQLELSTDTKPSHSKPSKIL